MSSVFISCYLSKSSTEDKPPNVIVIIADDIGWKDVGFQGNSYYETPNLDKLASCSITFNNAYSASPLCSPTRASILTGLYPSRIGLTRATGHRKVEITSRSDSLYKKHKTLSRLTLNYNLLSEELKKYGYTTAHFGKWHLGQEPYGPRNQGFDYQYPKYKDTAGPIGGYLSQESEIFSEYSESKISIQEIMSNEVLKYIDRNLNIPFFIHYSDYSVHGPFSADLDKIKYFEDKAAQNLELNPVTAAIIFEMDRCIGKIIDFLKDKKLLDNTILIWVSDNGGNIATKGERFYKSGSYKYAKDKPITINRPLKNGKGSLYEGGIRVPLIFSFPKKLKSHKNNSIVSTTDIYPTVMEIVSGSNLTEKAKLDGNSIYSSLVNQNDADNLYFTHKPFYSAKSNPMSAVRIGKYKLIRTYFTDENSSLQLFDLDNDIGETNNIIKDYPSISNFLKDKLDSLIVNTNSETPEPQ